MTTIRALMLAQQARHEAWTHPAGGTTCLVCGEEYPCADRVAADAVIAQLGERDAEIRQHLEAMAPARCRWSSIGQPSCAEHPDTRGDSKQWCYACVNRSERQAILALLTPDEQAAP